jgi:hypothetical protein
MPSIDDNGIGCKEMNPFPTVHPQLVCLTALLLPSDVLFPLTIGLRAISAPLSSFNISVNSCLCIPFITGMAISSDDMASVLTFLLSDETLVHIANCLLPISKTLQMSTTCCPLFFLGSLATISTAGLRCSSWWQSCFVTFTLLSTEVKLACGLTVDESGGGISICEDSIVCRLVPEVIQPCQY